MYKIFMFMKPYTGFMLCAALLLFLEAIGALILPGTMANIIDDGVIPGHVHVIWRLGGIMILVSLLSSLAALCASFFAAKTSAGVANDLRTAVFKKVLSFSDAEINKFNTSSLITRTTGDVVAIQSVMMMGIRQFIYAPIIAVGGIIRASGRSDALTWVVSISVIIMIIFMLGVVIIATPYFERVQKLIDRLNLVSRENLSGILISKAFNTQQFEKKRFSKANRELNLTNLFINRTMAVTMPFIFLIMNIVTVVIVWVGALEVSAFRIDIGDIFAFLQYGMLIIFAFLMIGIMLIMLPSAYVSAQRIKEVLDTESSIKYNKNMINLTNDFLGNIEFKNVSFRYPSNIESTNKTQYENVIENISFKVVHGSITAIIGATGSGKSTILNLLLRFYDVTEGDILLDGISIRDINKKSLHDKIGYVAQKALLFSGSIKSNLLYADKNASDTSIDRAIDIAQAKSFIENKEDGLYSNVAQGATNFSGGQRQRLSIARALVKDVPIYLFDDSFSALDLKTDANLRAALKTKVKGSTKIIVAQRVSSIMEADQIIVLEHGRIVGKGRHNDLMNTCNVYKEIAQSQLSEVTTNT